MTCEEFEHDSYLPVDKISDELNQSLTEHLKGCSSCRKSMELGAEQAGYDAYYIEQLSSEMVRGLPLIMPRLKREGQP